MPATLLQFAKHGSSRPIDVEEIDRRLCLLLGVPYRTDAHVQNWYGSIGMGLAIGLSLEDQIDEAEQGRADCQGSDPETKPARTFWATRLKILHFLKSHYHPLEYEAAAP